jgi:hypothetical protein
MESTFKNTNKACWDLELSADSRELWVASSKGGDNTRAIYHSIDQGSTWEEIKGVPQIGACQINVIEKGKIKTVIIGGWQDGIYSYQKPEVRQK